jgi:hypothetical protein
MTILAKLSKTEEVYFYARKCMLITIPYKVLAMNSALS